MLPANKRLNLKQNFRWVRSGQSFETAHMLLFYRKSSTPHSLVGVAVTSKLFPKAVIRNRVKRVVFAAFGQVYDKLPENLYIVALPKTGVDKIKSEELKKEALEFVENFGRAG